MRTGAALGTRFSGALALALLFSRLAQAQVPEAPSTEGAGDRPTEDRGVESANGAEREREPEPSRFAGSTLSLDNSVTAQTVGLGADYQSRNPTYDVQLGLRARYRLWNEGDARSLALAGRIAVARELTESDTTTNRGEWDVTGADVTDTDLLLSYSHELARGEFSQTVLNVALPWLSLPSSKASREGGKILGAGTTIGLTQTLPLRAGEPLLPSVRLRPRVGYLYQFNRAVVATSDNLQRMRLDPLGRTTPSDQLAGVALAQHQALFVVTGGVDISRVVKFDVDLGWLVAYQHALDEDVQICTVATGCVTPEPADDPPNALVSTVFEAELLIDAPKPVAFSFAYENLALQLGSDGTRRNMLYSPEARLVASVILRLDAFYEALDPNAGERRSAGYGERSVITY